MTRFNASRLVGIAGGVMTLLGFPIGKVESATPSIKAPGPYPYETPVQIPVPPQVPESSPLPSPAPFPYSDSLAAAHPVRDSRTENVRHPPTAKAVREAAFKYNRVANFCGFLAALPADVSVFDPKLGTRRALVKGGHVVGKNVTWLRKRKQPQDKAEHN
jgi:hypothetical protein